MTSTDAIAAKNAFVLITNKFVIKTNAFFAAIRPKFKAFKVFRGVIIQPRCVVGPRSLLLILSWLRGLRPMCTRMSMDIRVHAEPQWQSTMRISSKTLSTSSLTINAPLIVKDEVDKDFRTYPFATKQKILCGLKAYCYLGPACPGALEGPQDRRVHDYYSNRIVII